MRNEVEHHWNISMPILKKRGFLKGYKSGNYRFHDYRTGLDDSVHITVSCGQGRENWVHFKYKYQFVNGIHDPDYKIPLTTTKCHYKGIRYWFICNFSNGGEKPCQNRVGVLYLKQGYYACRACHKLTYRSTNLSKARKGNAHIVPRGKLEEMRNAIKKFHYRGEPTKRYRRYIKKRDRSNAGFDGMVGNLSKDFKKVQEKLGINSGLDL